MAAKKPAAPNELYTIRLNPAFIAKLAARAKKDKCTHAQVARNAIEAYFAKAAA